MVLVETVESLLEVRDLSVCYRTQAGAEIPALTEAELQILPGEIVGVVGESGSGKSTLAAALLAVLPPNAEIKKGAVMLQGADLLRLDASELTQIRGSRVSLIYQEPGVALHPTLRAGTQVEEILRAHTKKSKEERRLEVKKLLRLIFGADTERIYLSYPHQLSGGQRQRVAIAQAIVCSPRLLIADEPTSSLDPLAQREILELLKKLRSELNLAILFITHSPELLYGFANRAIVMYGGRIVEVGDAARLLKSPNHPYTQLLLQCRPTFDQIESAASDSRIPVIPGDRPDFSVSLRGCVFEPRCPERIQICRERPPEFSNAGEGMRVRCVKFS